MSGGSLDYVYQKVSDAADEILTHADDNPLYLSFAKHLYDVADALHDVEWVIDADYALGDENEAINKVLPKE